MKGEGFGFVDLSSRCYKNALLLFIRLKPEIPNYLSLEFTPRQRVSPTGGGLELLDRI